MCTSKVNLLGLTRFNVCLLYSVEKPVNRHSITGSCYQECAVWVRLLCYSFLLWSYSFPEHTFESLHYRWYIWQCITFKRILDFLKLDMVLLQLTSETHWSVSAGKPHSLVDARLSRTAFLICRNRGGNGRGLVVCILRVCMCWGGGFKKGLACLRQRVHKVHFECELSWPEFNLRA